MNPLLFGEAADAAAKAIVIPSEIAFPILLACAIAAWYSVKHLKAKIVHGLVWMALGVVGAKSLPGVVASIVIRFVVKLVSGLDLDTL